VLASSFDTRLCYDFAVVRVLAGLLFVAVCGRVALAADQPDALARARVLYNQGQFDAAIAAAEEAGRVPERAASADLIAARTYLERYRLSENGEDLDAARTRLRAVDPALFTPLERVEFLVGLGETLFFDSAAGAAAVLFESVLLGQEYLQQTARERVLDWWATALDQEAKARAPIERQGVYQRIRDRMADELSLRPGNAAAAYWAAAAARGQGDFLAATDAIQAAWVRSTLAGERAVKLREDLDDLMRKAIIPERARVVAQPPETLASEWEKFKERWAK
jgi:hypothetical protein